MKQAISNQLSAVSNQPSALSKAQNKKAELPPARFFLTAAS
jgi:hypothetical protein